MTTKLKNTARRAAVVLAVSVSAASFGGVANAATAPVELEQSQQVTGFWDGPK